MRRALTSLFALISVAFLSIPASARTLVAASLVCNVDAVCAGKPFDVGIKLQMVPNWHTYWSNPGDAGLATQVKWTLPAGFTAGALQFPVPTRFDEPGGIVVYGYAGEVLLIATITPPADLKAGNPVPLSAKVSWLCCADVCVPGSATLQTTLPASDQNNAINTDLFDHWRSHLPVASKVAVTPMRLNDAQPHAEIFVDHPIADSHSIIPSAVDGLMLTVEQPKFETRRGIDGTVISIAGQVLKGQTITDKQFIVLLTGSDSSQTGRIGEQVSVPLESSKVVKE